MKIELSIIIVNYNGLKFLENCLTSLQENLLNINHEIIIVDNKSIDESCKFIKSHFPNVKLIESSVNLGFGQGNNLGVANALGQYLLLINNDTILLNQLKPILEFLKNDTKIGVVGINMLNAKKEFLSAAGNFPNFQNMLLFKKLVNLGKDFKNGNFTKDFYEVDWLCGSFFLMTKKIYQEINGFDNDFFMYIEDIDFCKRISDKGYKRIFLSKFNYIHFVGFNYKKNNQLVKGYQIYIDKHFYGHERIIMKIALRINKLLKTFKNTLRLE